MQLEADPAVVLSLIREITDEETSAWFRKLRPQDIENKSSTDHVTVADRGIEERLTGGLKNTVPGSLCAGEEAVHENPALLETLKDPVPVWIVDPIDGTYNFMRGEPDFSTMVALTYQGNILASWIYAPKLQLAAQAIAGMRASLNGQALNIPDTERVCRIVATHPHFQEETDQRLLQPLQTLPATVLASRGAGLEYIDLARGQKDAAVFTWEKPWDHAAGLLLHKEAGGRNGCRSGLPFSLHGGNDLPVIAARGQRDFDHLREVLTSDAAEIR